MSEYRDPRHPVETEADRRYADLRRVSVRLDAVLAAGIREGRRMTSMGAIGQRIAAKKAVHDAKADEWAARLDVVDALEPRAFAAGDAAVAEREADLAQFESDMKVLSNLPLAGSDTLAGG